MYSKEEGLRGAGAYEAFDVLLTPKVRSVARVQNVTNSVRTSVHLNLFATVFDYARRDEVDSFEVVFTAYSFAGFQFMKSNLDHSVSADGGICSNQFPLTDRFVKILPLPERMPSVQLRLTPAIHVMKRNSVADTREAAGNEATLCDAVHEELRR